MITYDLSLDELTNLLLDSKYEDGDIDTHNGYASLHSPSAMAHALVWTQPNNIIGFDINRYDELMSKAAPSGYTPLFIVSTPDGIFEFNMDIIKPQFELYSDGDKPDVLVADIPITKGKRILEFWPEFASEEDYLDSLMSDAEPSQWDDGDSW